MVLARAHIPYQHRDLRFFRELIIYVHKSILVKI